VVRLGLDREEVDGPAPMVLPFEPAEQEAAGARPRLCIADER
jgi:hypothetical protein